MAKLNIFFFFLIIITFVFIFSKEEQNKKQEIYVKVKTKEESLQPESINKEKVLKEISRINSKEKEITSTEKIEKEVVKETSKKEETEIIFTEKIEKKNNEKKYLEGIPKKLLEEYTNSTKGTSRENWPPFLFIVNMSFIQDEDRILVMQLAQEYHMQSMEIKKNEKKLFSKEISKKYEELNKLYEESFFLLLDTKEKKETYIKFLKKQIENSKYY